MGSERRRALCFRQGSGRHLFARRGGELAHAGEDAVVEMAAAKLRDDVVTNASRAAVGDRSLEPVSHADEYAVVYRVPEQQDAVVLSALAHAPGAMQRRREFLELQARGRVDDGHADLVTGLTLERAGDAVDLRDGRRLEMMRRIGDPAAVRGTRIGNPRDALRGSALEQNGEGDRGEHYESTLAPNGTS